MFVRNDLSNRTATIYYQSSMADKLFQKMDKGWAGEFRRHVMPAIDEDIFSVLYSSEPSRPNTPVNVVIGLLILNEQFGDGCIDDTIMRAATDISFHYALWCDDGIDEATCKKTMDRFLYKCARWDAEHGEDLIHKCFLDLASKEKKLMGIDGKLMRMDSLMIDDNVRSMHRLELLYVVISDMVLEMSGICKKRPKRTYTTIPFRNEVAGQYTFSNTDQEGAALSIEETKEEDMAAPEKPRNEQTTAAKKRSFRSLLLKMHPDLPEALLHYIDRDDQNSFLYHDKETSSEDKMSQVLSDAKVLVEYCGDKYKDNERYKILMRVLTEQCDRQKDGSYQLKKAGTGAMGSGICQNPYAPESTFCEKDGKQHRGDKATIVEQSNKEGESLTAEYEYGSNTDSDDSQGAAIIERMKEEGETQGAEMAADALFNGSKMQKALEGSGMTVTNTNITGKVPEDVHADHEFNEEGGLEKCAAGKIPESTSCYSNGSVYGRMNMRNCRECEHYKECYSQKEREKHDDRLNKAEEKGKDTSGMTVQMRTSPKMKLRAEQQRSRNTEQFRDRSCYRNGIESGVAHIRNDYRVDSMPPVGRIGRKLRFGIKLIASNAFRTVKSTERRAKSALVTA